MFLTAFGLPQGSILNLSQKSAMQQRARAKAKNYVSAKSHNSSKSAKLFGKVGRDYKLDWLFPLRNTPSERWQTKWVHFGCKKQFIKKCTD